MNSTSVQTPPAGDFTERLVDGFFRRWFLYVLPVLLFAAIGVYSASGMTGEFASYGRLSATTNPYVDEPEIRGTEIAFYETPADGTARLINEQLQTDAFIDDVASRAGLTGALDAEFITRMDIRSRVNASASGQNNLVVGASWGDPETAQLLVQETIIGYGTYLQEIAVADSDAAVEFWTERRSAAEREVQAAQQALDDYIGNLPPLAEGEERSIAEELTIQRLNSTLDRALAAASQAEGEIDAAQFSASQAARNSAGQLQLIDPPTVAPAPTPVRRDQILATAIFTLLGVVIAFAALLLGTVADRTVRTRAQLGYVTGLDAVVAIPHVKQLGRRRWGRATRQAA